MELNKSEWGLLNEVEQEELIEYIFNQYYEYGDEDFEGLLEEFLKNKGIELPKHLFP